MKHNTKTLNKENYGKKILSLSTKETSTPPWVNKIDNQKAIFKGSKYIKAKRMMDLTLTILSLPIVLPILGICALAIKLEDWDAPTIYSQQRDGQGGKLFNIYKFRTMVPNAEELKRKYAHLNELEWPDFKIKNDPRITHIGKFLRRTSLDELPQIFNILCGNMSIVGPRPTDFGADKYDIWHTERFDVLPGVTGLWQILGRGEPDFDEKLRLDILYVNKRCLKLDLAILFKTIPVLLLGKGSY